MLIGQDLLNAHFNMTPLQPTYHITPSLAIIRTKMGLVFIGKFNTKKFKRWRLTSTEVKRMKKALYPDNEKSDSRIKISSVQKEKLNNTLAFKVFDIKRSWKEYACKYLAFLKFVTLKIIFLFRFFLEPVYQLSLSLRISSSLFSWFDSKMSSRRHFYPPSTFYQFSPHIFLF